MNWRYKAMLQNAIARLPMSDAVYYGVQRTMGDLRHSRFDPMEWIDVVAEMLGSLQRDGIDIGGKRVLEVGTGRAVGAPLALWLCGAEQVVTVDLNRYLSLALVLDSIGYLRRNAEKVKTRLAEYDGDDGLGTRWEQLCSFSGTLGSLLELTRIEYLAPGDATRLPFPDHWFDLHFSYSVLEHVPPAEIVRILQEARRVLRPNAALFHTIDLSDHFFYGDASLSRINFLRFSERQWKFWAGNKYMYHNRLRAPEMLRLFEEAGVGIIREVRALDQRSLQLLQESRFPLDRRFTSFPPEELAVTALQVTGSFTTLQRHTDSGRDLRAYPVEWKRR